MGASACPGAAHNSPVDTRDAKSRGIWGYTCVQGGGAGTIVAMDSPHQAAALKEVLRINARLSASMSSKDAEIRAQAPDLRCELESARAILAVERGLAEYVRKGGKRVLTADQVEAITEHLRNREGH